MLTGGSDLVWTSNYQANDDDWLLRSYDISAWADNKSSVQVEFRLDSDDPDHSYGWNIDELIVKDRTEPDYEDCAECGSSPTFRGVTAVYDPDPCGVGGLLVEWDDAVAWGTGTSGTFDVHRGTAPDFVPGTANRVAIGIVGWSWQDVTAPVGVPVWYVVRARNDESCSSGEGLADDNTVSRGAIETNSLSPVTPLGDTVIARTVADAHLRLEWTPVAGADHYLIRRATARDYSDAVDVATTSSTLFEDFGAAAEMTSYSYRVFAVDACGRVE